LANYEFLVPLVLYGRTKSVKLQKKFSFVTTMDDLPREMRSIFHWGVPDVITWKVMEVCARHL